MERLTTRLSEITAGFNGAQKATMAARMKMSAGYQAGAMALSRTDTKYSAA